MLDFKIDEIKCTQCGLCSQECPTLIINGKKGIPEIKDGKEPNCIKCQHCLAVCPTGALSILGKNPEDSVLVKGEIPSPESMGRLMKTRRSTRKFTKEELDQDLIKKLLETAAYAPTGHNKNSVLFSITQTKEELSKVRSLVYDSIKKANEEGTLLPHMNFMANLQQLWETKGVDVLFRDAPHLIIATAPRKISSPEADSHISLSYFELLANSYGLGTLWNGMVKWVLEDIAPDIKTQIGIPEDHVMGYVMIFGKPAVKYARSIQSDGLSVNKISLS